MFSFALFSANMSLMVNPLSAIIDTPGLSYKWSNNPDIWMSLKSDVDSTYSCKTNDMQPLGVQPIKNFMVL